MRLLLDSQAVYLWLRDEPFPDRADAALSDARNHLVVSAATVWELAIKYESGKLALADGQIDSLLDVDLNLLDITPIHTLAVARLPRLHGDPFDRMLIAQAQIEELTLVGGDAMFAAYGVQTLWD